MISALVGLLLLLSGPAPSGRGHGAGPRLERVTFTASSRLPGTVIRLAFSGRVTEFALERDARSATVRLTARPASLRSGATCIAPESLGRCAIRAVNDGVLFELSAAGQVLAADAYRDGTEAGDLLVYVHVGPVPAPATPALSVAASTVDPPGNSSDDTAAVAREDDLEKLKLDTVVLDAGHGGTDPGTIGYNRMREKDLVLDIARRVGVYLERAGFRVAYTRDDDRFIPLKDRGRIAREAGGELFVSIHANSAPDRAASGTETFFLGTHKTDAARDVIERENRVIDLEEDREHYEQYNAAQLARLRLTQSAHLRQSQDLASRIQEQYRERAGRKDRKVKEGNLYVLWSAGMPAILTEIGFISNPSEARYLTTEEGRDHIASAIFRAIRDYRDAHDAALEVAQAH